MDKIDLVVPYVDSSDKNWQELFNKYNPNVGEQLEGVNAANRFRGQGDFFRFFFRGVEKNIPWINKIHLIVQSETQIPEWLDRKKVHIVYHSDFIPEDFLPTFNSCTIEMFLWNIPGLSEKFLYSNDDTFIMKPLSPSKFFSGEKIINGLYSRKNFSKLGMWGHHIINSFNTIFGNIDNKLICGHTVRGYFKSVMRECFNNYKDIILNSISNFREEKNINVYLYDYYLLKKELINKFGAPTSCVIASKNNDTVLLKKLKSGTDIVCVQDTDTTDNDIYTRVKLIQEFKLHLGNACSLELLSKAAMLPDAQNKIDNVVSKMPDRLKDKIRKVLTNKLSY